MSNNISRIVGAIMSAQAGVKIKPEQKPKSQTEEFVAVIMKHRLRDPAAIKAAILRGC
jgi:hypothetical protein